MPRLNPKREEFVRRYLAGESVSDLRRAMEITGGVADAWRRQVDQSVGRPKRPPGRPPKDRDDMTPVTPPVFVPPPVGPLPIPKQLYDETLQHLRAGMNDPSATPAGRARMAEKVLAYAEKMLEREAKAATAASPADESEEMRAAAARAEARLRSLVERACDAAAE